MKSIVFNEQQLEAYKNGATMFLVPISHPHEYYNSRNQQAIRIEPENDPWYKDRNYCIREEGGGWQDFTKQDFLNYVKAPLQKGDEFFIQEEFFGFIEDSIKYKEKDYIDGGLNKIESWQPASQMQEHQARFKDVVLDVEVKRVQDVCAFDFFASFSFEQSNGFGGFDILYHINGDEYDETTICDYYDEYINKQFENAQENPYVFLYTIKGK